MIVLAFDCAVEGGRRSDGNAEAGRGLTLSILTAVDLIVDSILCVIRNALDVLDCA